jgi:hypothetical protein
MMVKRTNKIRGYTNLPSITYGLYWSATEYASRTNYAWLGYFYNGFISYSDKGSTDNHTICIHD